MTLFLPRVLPGDIDKSVEATVLNADRWNAGGALMRSGNLAGWCGLVDANKDALRECAEAAEGEEGAALHHHRGRAGAVAMMSRYVAGRIITRRSAIDVKVVRIYVSPADM